jgi:hypothetical protein
MTNQMLTNQKELKQIYTFEKYPSASYDFAHNLAERLGICTMNNDTFNPYLNKLVNAGILTKQYDFTSSNFREALYTFKNGHEIEFFGSDHMSYRLFYNY